MKNIGKPCAGKPHARFDEGGLANAAMEWLFRHRQMKRAETDKPNLKLQRPALYSTHFFHLTYFLIGDPIRGLQIVNNLVLCPRNSRHAPAIIEVNSRK